MKQYKGSIIMKKKIMFTVFILILLFSMVCLYGDDTQSCMGCNGSGKVIVYCQTCGGMGGFLYNGYYMICNVCGGARGYLAPCSFCKGTGKVKVPKSAPGQNNSFTPMPVPVNPAPSGGGGAKSQIKCQTCNGTGKCIVCGGVPEIKCKNCEGIGKTWVGYGSNRKFDYCPVCKGKGYNLCTASGYRCLAGKCSICLGKGYYN
jgi:hypothetical protein